MAVQVCVILPTGQVFKGRPEGIRRNLYFALERYAYRTPLGWVVDYEVCRELLEKRLAKMNEEYLSLTGQPLFRHFTIAVPVEQLRELLALAERAPASEVAKKLEKAAGLGKHLVEVG